jgi:hypothetical protein
MELMEIQIVQDFVLRIALKIHSLTYLEIQPLIHVFLSALLFWHGPIIKQETANLSAPHYLFQPILNLLEWGV